ncbi:MAG: hypothetical protein V7K54_08630 [Nostoc sp.]
MNFSNYVNHLIQTGRSQPISLHRPLRHYCYAVFSTYANTKILSTSLSPN